MRFWYWLTQAYRDGHYADFKGAAPRGELLSLIVFQLLVFLLISIVGAICLILVDRPNEVVVWPIYFAASLFVVFGLYSLVPSLSVLFRRLHDAGYSAWWCGVLVVPMILQGTELAPLGQWFSVLFSIVLLLLPSKTVGNRYLQ